MGVGVTDWLSGEVPVTAGLGQTGLFKGLKIQASLWWKESSWLDGCAWVRGAGEMPPRRTCPSLSVLKRLPGAAGPKEVASCSASCRQPTLFAPWPEQTRLCRLCHPSGLTPAEPTHWPSGPGPSCILEDRKAGEVRTESEIKADKERAGARHPILPRGCRQG